MENNKALELVRSGNLSVEDVQRVADYINTVATSGEVLQLWSVMCLGCMPMTKADRKAAGLGKVAYKKGMRVAGSLLKQIHPLICERLLAVALGK